MHGHARPLVVASGLLLLFGCAAPTSGAVTAARPSQSSVPAPAVTQESASPTAGPSSAVLGPSAPPAAAAPAHTEVPPGLISGNLGVLDQTGDGTRLHLSAEVDGGPGWVVVQADDNGHPGKIVGKVHRGDGVHDDIVTVRLHPRVSTGLLWVTLYLDLGRRGVFEHPGPDTPLQFVGQDLQRSATLTVVTPQLGASADDEG
jgi:hypothetical protein